LRAGQRLFRLDRIVQIQMASETFPQRINFPALEAVSQALASVPRVWQVEVWLATTLEEAHLQTGQPKACFAEANGGVLLQVDVEDLPWMARLLAGLGVPFIVHRPCGSPALVPNVPLPAGGGFTLTRWWPPSIALGRPDDQIRDDLRPALLALLLKKRQRRLDLRDSAGRHRDQQMSALPIL
jgi:hypothetical protein